MDILHILAVLGIHYVVGMTAAAGMSALQDESCWLLVESYSFQVEKGLAVCR